MTTVRLYGRTTNWGSHAQVTEGFRIALEEHGMLAGVRPVDLAVDEDSVPGRAAPVGLLTGSLTTLSEIAPTHRLRAAVVAPNSSRIPVPLAKAIDAQVHLVLAPSQWAEGVLRRELRESIVITVPHGVHPGMVVHHHAREDVLHDFCAGAFRLLHFSTTDRGRKGTVELLQAWAMVRKVLPSAARLFLVLDPNAKARLADDIFEHGLSVEGVEIRERADILQQDGRIGSSPAVIASLLSQFHGVIQPSRGEGFGLIPLEARACGVPVIATTNATGHTEHLRNTHYPDGVVPVRTGSEEPIDDVPGATAPSLDPKDIVEAILEAHECYEILHANALESAPSVQKKWAWPTVVKPFLEEIERFTHE
jgi:glycosyltransferase involved in cell wall biosynthesis